MSKFFHLAKAMSRQPKPKIKSAKLIKFNVQVLNSVILTLVIFLGVTYLVQINGLVSQGYQIKDLEVEISQLQQAADDLRLESLGLQSMDNVQGKISQLNMVEAGPVEYLQVTPLVAVAR
ncbi:MAG: hypothetical protein A2744_04335 [Candidatus Buchananbacteria bacterium RIFCSPHIGHO2_01_FULL_44_11]|uniref:Cell division protein FtsL n=1 Tax=Candidatus Buchananbacteria bacterium RIFCSPHIGHO2_01_FULL_44_11 TaxID=1797535 RepID=A0A1G1XZP7_9BACT|nr:MAG: hypothetical protein A2744_04335 [Candidatus Buchananbacteria bacterium RIFCSPHIGHO2_01_FULL_44_11]